MYVKKQQRNKQTKTKYIIKNKKKTYILKIYLNLKEIIAIYKERKTSHTFKLTKKQ